MRKYLLDCLKKGIEIEKEGAKFYSDAAASIKDPKGKSTLEFLAKEEGRHREFIQALIDSINAGSAIADVVRGGVPKIFPQKEKFAINLAATKGDKKILEEAIGVEDRSIEFYTGCHANTKGHEQDIFRILIEEEEKHKAWLDYMKDGMDVHGYWYGIGDFSFDGS